MRTYTFYYLLADGLEGCIVERALSIAAATISMRISIREIAAAHGGYIVTSIKSS